MNCFWQEFPNEEGKTSEAANDEGQASTSSSPSTSFQATCSAINPENLLTCQLARIASCLPILWASDSGEGGSLKAFSPHRVR